MCLHWKRMFAPERLKSVNYVENCGDVPLIFFPLISLNSCEI
jgi:hypothetical protein